MVNPMSFTHATVHLCCPIDSIPWPKCRVDTKSNGRPADRPTTRCSRLNKQRPYEQANQHLVTPFRFSSFHCLFVLVFSANVGLFSGLRCRRFGDLNCFFLQRISIKLALWASVKCLCEFGFDHLSHSKLNSRRTNLYKFWKPGSS